MTVKSQSCDFCGEPDLLGQEDTRSLVFFLENEAVLWDGVCREGSLIYFKPFDSLEMVKLIQKTHAVLSLEGMALLDDADSRLKRDWLEDELWRAKQELVFRVMEAQ